MFDSKKYYIKNREKMIEYSKQRYKDNPKKAIEYNKQWRKDNPEKRKEERRRYYQKNIERERERGRKRKIKNPEKEKERLRKYGENNREKIKERRKKYRENNHEKVRKQDKEYCKKRYTKKWYKDKIRGLKFVLNRRISGAIREALKGNKSGRHWEDLVGYTLNDLIKRLKKTMPKSYSWNDFLEGSLHIDHIIPISAFNFSKSEHIDFKKCWSLKNLQLLPAKENMSKSNKLTKPFQPTLEINFK